MPSPSPSCVPSQSPSHACPLNDLDNDNSPFDTVDPKCKQSQAPSPSPSHACPSGDVDDDDDEPFDSDAGDLKSVWDLHAGLKPMPLDEAASDEAALDEVVSDEEGEIESDVPYGGEKEVNGPMIDMMVKLGDCEECDMEWLSAKEWKKVEARKKGTVSF